MGAWVVPWGRCRSLEIVARGLQPQNPTQKSPAHSDSHCGQLPCVVQQQMPELQRVDSTPSPKAPSMWIGHSLRTLESTGKKHEYWGVCAPRRATPWDPRPLYSLGLSRAGPKGPAPPSEGGGPLTCGLPSLYWTLASSQCWLPGLPPAPHPALLLLTLRTQCGPGSPEAAPPLSPSAPSPGLPPGGLRAVCPSSGHDRTKLGVPLKALSTFFF